MVNPNYVPEWYISPFQHVQYTLARNQLHMDLLFEDMGKADQFLDMGADAQVSSYSDGAYAIVQIGDTADKDQIQVYGLLLHEAVHVWQIVKKRMGERDPSVEFEAYSIQAIAQDLFEMFEASEVKKHADEHVKKITMDTVQSLVVSSPVDTGAYRASHIVSVGSGDYGVREPSTNAVQDAAIQAVKFKLGSLIYIQNNQPYAERLENGWSDQAPQGIYSTTFTYITQKYGG